MPNITIARRDDHFAVYMLGPDDVWTLVASGKGEDANVEGIVRGVASGGIIRDIDAPHLHAGGTWVETVASMEPPTPRQILAAEVLDLDVQAARLAESAAFSGDRGDRGARGLRDRADTIRHAVLVLTGEPLPDRIPTRF